MDYKDMSLGELISQLSRVVFSDTVYLDTEKESSEGVVNSLIYNINLKLPKSPFPNITAEYIRDVIVLAQFTVHRFNKKYDIDSILNVIDTAQKRVDKVLGSPLSFKATEAKEEYKPVSY